ncbi:MAG: S-methyl-5'-thioadenosine phosphorylase [Bacillota bacterium]
MHTVFAIIGGTGFYQPTLLQGLQEMEINTPYGTVPFQIGDYQGKRVVFLARHGKEHHLPPHRINYRANIAALREIEANYVLSTTAVGSLRQDIPRGMLVVIDQFIDLTKCRKHTFYDGTGGEVVHTDFTEPYCSHLRKHLCRVLKRKGIPFQEKGTYICTEGPRYETPAEVKAYANWGGDVVGMTNVPEVTLAREAGLCYASLSLVTNYAAGLSSQPLTHQEVVEEMREKISMIRDVFMETIVTLPEKKDCRCSFKEDYKLG